MEDLPNKTYMNEDEFCAWLGVTKNHSAVMRHEGKSPPFIKINAKRIVYRVEDIKKWLDDKVTTRKLVITSGDQG